MIPVNVSSGNFKNYPSTALYPPSIRSTCCYLRNDIGIFKCQNRISFKPVVIVTPSAALLQHKVKLKSLVMTELPANSFSEPPIKPISGGNHEIERHHVLSIAFVVRRELSMTGTSRISLFK